MAFSPFANAKAHWKETAFWVFVGFIALTAIDARVGGKIIGFVRKIPVIGGQV